MPSSSECVPTADVVSGITQRAMQLRRKQSTLPIRNCVEEAIRRFVLADAVTVAIEDVPPGFEEFTSGTDPDGEWIWVRTAATTPSHPRAVHARARRPRDPAARERFDACAEGFRSALSEWALLRDIVLGVERSDRVGRFAQRTQWVQEYLHDGPVAESLAEAIERATDVMKRLVDTGGDIREEVIVRHVHNLVFGMGRDDREIELSKRVRDAIKAFSKVAIPNLSETSDLAAYRQALADAAHDPAPFDELGSSPGGTSMAWLLWEWTRLHMLAQRRLVPGAKVIRPDPFPNMVHAASARLAVLLTQAFERDGAVPPLTLDGATTKPRDMVRIRSWLRLWLCLEVVQNLRGTSDEAANVYVYLEDATYVVRECLRSWEHVTFMARVPDRGPRAATFTLRQGIQPGPFLDALCGVVTAHAHGNVQVDSSYAVARLLSGIRSSHSADEYLRASGHLEHVVDVYSATQFLLAARVGDKRVDVAGVLGRSGTDTDRANLRRQAALAALYHDSGMAIFSYAHRPRPPTPKPATGTTAKGPMMAAFAAIEAGFSETGQALGKTCAESVLVTVEKDERHLEAWVNKQAKEALPDHAVVGAWYLTQFAPQVPRHAPDLRAAVRAILLHGCVTAPIDPDTDPVAALLVLCDQLFEWDPALRPGPAPRAVAWSEHAIAVDMPPPRNRIRAFDIAGLGVEACEATVAPTLTLPEPGAPWPRTTCVLQPADVVGHHPWQVWLLMAQNLQRVRPVERWGPRVDVACFADSSILPFEEQNKLLTTLVRHGPSSAEFIDEWQKGAAIRCRDCYEIATLSAKGTPLAPHDLRECHDELRKAATTVIESAAAKRRP